jgi:hypothetical protein
LCGCSVLTRGATAEGAEAKRKVRFYWLDQVNCEGVGHPAAELRSVKDYTKDNRTEERLGEWEWFKDLVGSVGSKKLDEKLMERWVAPPPPHTSFANSSSGRVVVFLVASCVV